MSLKLLKNKVKSSETREIRGRDLQLQGTQGLYHRGLDHDSCGIGFVADIKGRKCHRIVDQGLTVLANLTHRGAVGADPLAGDGAGMLLQIPDGFLRPEMA